LDIAQGEKVEGELDIFISRRDTQRRRVEGERPEHEIWQESEDRYNARRRREMRAQWYGWHCDQAERHRRTLEALIAHHELEAEKLCSDPTENGNGHHGNGHHKKGAA
jgi:hypothetical protein